MAVTGEEYVLLSLLEVLLSVRARGEPMRSAFIRARDSGMLDGIPGLVYARGDEDGVAEELVDTGMQRLLGDLDELPHPALGYGLLEPPEPRPTLSDQSLAGRTRSASTARSASLVLTFGCKFDCPYCPIPAYNQRQHRVKSGERIADEFDRLNREYGISYFFGADDNFFNDKQRDAGHRRDDWPAVRLDGRTFRKVVRWGTEVTVHDTLQMTRPPAAVRAGRRAGPVAGRRGHDRHAGQEGPERGQDDRGLPPAATARHLPDAHDDAPRRPAACTRRASPTACSTRSGCCARPGPSACRC